MMIYQNSKEKNMNHLKKKLINHLGYDKNCYISFEMYEMMLSLGYKIVIKKYWNIDSDFMKPYIDFLFEKKSYY